MSFTNDEEGEWGTIANFILLEKKKDFKQLIRCLSPSRDATQPGGNHDVGRYMLCQERVNQFAINVVEGVRAHPGSKTVNAGLSGPGKHLLQAKHDDSHFGHRKRSGAVLTEALSDQKSPSKNLTIDEKQVFFGTRFESLAEEINEN